MKKLINALKVFWFVLWATVLYDVKAIKELADIKKELSDIKEQLSDTESAYSNCTSKRLTISNELDSCKNLNKSLENSLQDARNSLTEVQTNLTKSIKLSSDKNKTIDDLNSKVDLLTKDLKVSDDTGIQLAQSNIELINALSDKDGIIKSLKDNQKLLAENRDKALEACNERNVKLPPNKPKKKSVN